MNKRIIQVCLTLVFVSVVFIVINIIYTIAGDSHTLLAGFVSGCFIWEIYRLCMNIYNKMMKVQGEH